MDNNLDMEVAVGLRFRPTEEELVVHYLLHKVHGNKNIDNMIPDVDIHIVPPWNIPSVIIASSPFQKDPDEVYFFCRIQFMNSSGKKVRRKDEFGYWKCTGTDRSVKTRDKRREIGWKKILVYKKDDDPDDAPTEYSMHEYHLNDDLAKDAPTDTRNIVLCALKRNGHKQAKGCSPRRKGKGKRSVSEVTNGETPREKKSKAKEGAKKFTDLATPNNIICPTFCTTICDVINASGKQISEEAIAETMPKNVSTPAAIETPRSILLPSLNSLNISPALSPITPIYVERKVEAPFSHEVNPKKPETPHEGCVGDNTMTCEENPISAPITGTEIVDRHSIEMPLVVYYIKYKNDKKEAKPSSIHKQDPKIDVHGNPLATISESEAEEHPVSVPTTPKASTTQAAYNTSSAESFDEEWGPPLKSFSSSYQDMPLGEDPYWISKEMEELLNSNQE